MAHILLYGGTFDPIHHGHLITCRSAREALGAEGVLLIPAWVSPHKQDEPPASTAEQRLRMLELALAGAEDFALDAREVSRGGPSYTIDTVRELQRDRPQDRFTVLIGADQLPKLHTWHRIEALLAQGPMAVLARGAEAGGLEAARQHLGALVERLQILATPRVDISATAIRQRVARGLSISYLVPAAVAEFIAREGLYAARRPAAPAG